MEVNLKQRSELFIFCKRQIKIERDIKNKEKKKC